MTPEQRRFLKSVGIVPCDPPPFQPTLFIDEINALEPISKLLLTGRLEGKP